MSSSINDPLIGLTFDGYTIENLLGSGGMAQVYRAWDEDLARHVAIKMMAPHLNDDPDYEVRFRREARAVAQLRHQHIVSVHRFGESNGRYYMVMDYIDGADFAWVLADYLRRGELLSYEEILRILTPIAKALDYAHSRGVVHRDIKPSNIMLTQKGEPILTDFGLVRMDTEATHGDVFGSPHYIAPEQAINSAGAVPQSDLYALGVIIYQILTGKRPFEGDAPLHVAMAHITEPIPLPQLFYPELPVVFNAVLEQALAKEPQSRYESGEKLIHALRQAMKEAKKAGMTPGKVLRPASEGRELTISKTSIQNRVETYLKNAPPPGKSAPVPPAPVAAASISQPTAQATMTNAPAQNRPPATRKRSPILLLVIALLVLVIGGGAAFAFTQLNTESAPPPVTTVIEGPIRAISGNIITIYDVAIMLPDGDLLSSLQVGDVVWIEGSLSADPTTGNVIQITRVLNANRNAP